jgi:FixJ family two-component response regulator
MSEDPRVLVVEDDASMRRALGRLLLASGLDSVEFSSAEQLLQAKVCSASHCLVTDIYLGGMSGFELARVLRAEFPRLPIVFITAYDTPAARRKASNLQNAAYLTKPFESSDFINEIKKVRC